MYMSFSSISCGINEIVDIGYDPRQEDLNNIITRANCCILIASLRKDQVKGIKLLKKNGFKQTNRCLINPNSGSKIILFVRTIPKKERRKYGSSR